MQRGGIPCLQVGELQNSDPEHVKLYSLREVARLCRVSLATVRYWVSTRRIASIRPARLRLVTGAALNRFLDTRSREQRK